MESLSVGGGEPECVHLESQVPHLQLVQSFARSEEEEGYHHALIVNTSSEVVESSEYTGKGLEDLPQATESTFLKNEGEGLRVKETLCSLCNCKNFDESQVWVKLQDELNFQVYHMGDIPNESRGIKIIDVLETIYRFNGSSFNSLKVRDDVYMCSKCVTMLSQLYELYQGFIVLSTKTSSILSEIFSDTCTRDRNQREKSLDANQSSGNGYSSMSSTSFSNCAIVKNTSNAAAGVDVSRTANLSHGNPATEGNSNTISKTSNGKRNPKMVSTNPSRMSNRKRVVTKKQLQRSLFPHDTSPNRNSTTAKMIKMDNDSVKKQQQEFSVIENDADLGETSCDRCGKSFRSSSGLKIHYASHVRDDNKLSCKVCGKRFAKIEALKLHDKVDHEGFKPYKCSHDGCDKSFRLKDKLRLHIKVIHEKTKPFPCPKCEKSFRTNYHLKAHDVTQHVQSNGSIGCSKCKRKFSSKHALETHMKEHTAFEDEKPFMCSTCNKGFPTSARLKLHSKSHQLRPTCICPVCGKAYKHMRDLHLHEIVHQDESQYRFACGDCPKKFYRIDLLRVHQSNEKHFSPEVVGPSICKLLGSRTQSRRKNKEKGINIISDDEDDEDFDLIDDEPSHIDFPNVETAFALPVNVNKRYSSISKGNITPKMTHVQPSISTASLYPTMVEISLDNDREETPILEDMDLPSLQSTLSLCSQRTTQDISGSSLTVNSRDRMPTLLQQQSNSNLTIPLQNSSLMIGGNTLYTLKDSSDKSISAFCISAGAEQIGFDVINAFINNLS
ncbi:unnamed protein product [Orchesella dallaii]|uniref:C2H2-type domain-containing protein n=1 Tax=Orchesella dallaii TaxID=48710 RepID=A0ABP1R9B0_9HEXA